MKKFSHFEADKVKMVDIKQKKPTHRCAIARAILSIEKETLTLLQNNTLVKGNAFTTSKIAAIQAAKKTSDFIPLCHPLALENIEVEITLVPEICKIHIQTKVQSFTKTGVEMEALFALSTACLTLYDMCKSVDKKILIEKQGLYKKSGGKSGDFMNPQLDW